MTYLFPVADLSKSNDPLWDSPADWISPGFDDRGPVVHRPTARKYSTPITSHRSQVALCGCGSSADTTRSCTTWAFGGGMPPDPSEGNPSFIGACPPWEIPAALRSGSVLP